MDYTDSPVPRGEREAMLAGLLVTEAGRAELRALAARYCLRVGAVTDLAAAVLAHEYPGEVPKR